MTVELFIYWVFTFCHCFPDSFSIPSKSTLIFYTVIWWVLWGISLYQINFFYIQKLSGDLRLQPICLLAFYFHLFWILERRAAGEAMNNLINHLFVWWYVNWCFPFKIPELTYFIGFKRMTQSGFDTSIYIFRLDRWWKVVS